MGLLDGRIALVLQLPAGGGAISGQSALREAWLLDPASGRMEAFARAIRAAALNLPGLGTSSYYVMAFGSDDSLQVVATGSGQSRPVSLAVRCEG